MSIGKEHSLLSLPRKRNIFFYSQLLFYGCYCFDYEQFFLKIFSPNLILYQGIKNNFNDAFVERNIHAGDVCSCLELFGPLKSALGGKMSGVYNFCIFLTWNKFLYNTSFLNMKESQIMKRMLSNKTLLFVYYTNPNFVSIFLWQQLYSHLTASPKYFIKG